MNLLHHLAVQVSSQFARLWNQIPEMTKGHTNGVRAFGDETAEDYDHTRR